MLLSRAASLFASQLAQGSGSEADLQVIIGFITLVILIGLIATAIYWASRRSFTPPTKIHHVTWSPDSKQLVVASPAGLHFYDARTGQQIQFIKTDRDVWGAVFSPDGQLLASRLEDGTTKLWEVASGRELRIPSVYADSITCVAFSPEGRLLALGCGDGTVHLWEIANRQELHTLSGPPGRVTSVAFSPNGRLLAAGSDTGTVKVWNIAKLAAHLSVKTEQLPSTDEAPTKSLPEPQPGPVRERHGYSPPAPKILGPVYESTAHISVSGCLSGATIKVYNHRGTLIGSATHSGPTKWTIQIEVNSAAMIRGSRIYATQTYNGIESPPSDFVMVQWDESY